MTEQPNIVYILVDNFGWGDVSVQGGLVPTPRIDQLAGEGLRLTNFNVEAQCTPTRSGPPDRPAPDPIWDPSGDVRAALRTLAMGVHTGRSPLGFGLRDGDVRQVASR